ncbi:MAG TPA: ribonuclease R, partial [Mollicutes bacterium]|nr:ribonuclease R [Mollicutes bacterium]
RIEKKHFKDANHKDTVLIEVDKKKQDEGKIIKVIERDNSNLVGEYYVENNVGYVKMDNPRYKDYIIDIKDSKGAVEGHKVYVRKIKDLQNGDQQGEVLKIIGHKDDVGVDIASIVYEYGIPMEFSEKVKEELETIPNSVVETDLVGRRDLRGETIVTIDGDDAKDFDDAISIKKTSDGHYLLGVHIADVSHYVKEDSAIGKEAYDRGTSVYLVDRVIPMLPHQLSNGICSLNEGVDRLTLSCTIEIDSNGNFVNYDIYTAVINSKKRMTYKNVNKILENNEVIEGYEPFIDDLKLMSELADILRANMTRRGYLDFDTDEMKIIVDKEGNPIEITKRDRGTGEKIIEMFMIAANEAVASYVFWLGKEMVYRVHEEPDDKKIQELINFLNGCGIRLKGKSKRFSTKMMQEILSIFSESEAKQVYMNTVLRAMKKARYSADNLGHFGLGSKLYTHFTSPIRRLPDLIVHRIVKTALQIKGYNKNYTYDQLSVWSDHASLTEDRSVKCERAVEKYEAARYMENHIGEEYDAIIASVSRDGIWVQLKNLIEGLIKISEIGTDYYDFDEKMLLIRGRRTGKLYRIGDKVRVVVTGASRETSEIDFAFVKKGVN